MPPFGKLLIANRGEIVARIARTARRLQLRTVAVYSEADRGAPYLSTCDEAVEIGPAPASESYLSIARILEAARATDADAVHPGYGFLSENAAFATACAAAGLVFVGPPAAAIAAMGDKAAAKARMVEAAVPTLPSFAGAQDAAAFARAASGIGYPVMLKATAGGGGKGMRLVEHAGDFEKAFVATRQEAERAFGSGELLVERAVTRGRHVEIQIFADGAGHVVALGERDCSMQRRHQKVVEEAPSPALDDALRAAMEAAAIDAARAVGYEGAGTIEFLLAPDGAFYFLEMNTRLQVEHAVTEMIHGIDLVAWQLRVAAGERLEALLPERNAHGAAIEVRLYAEDPATGFLPQAGRIVAWREPSGTGVRVDAALRAGLEIAPYYDPMLAKIVAAGSDREEARRRLVRALEETTCLGIATNRTFLIAALEQPAFVRGDVTTGFIAEHLAALSAATSAGEGLRGLAAVLFYVRDRPRGELAGWRSRPWGATPLWLRFGDERLHFGVERCGGDRFTVAHGEQRESLELLDDGPDELHYISNGIARHARYTWSEGTLSVHAGRDELSARDATFESRSAGTREGATTSPMPGIVTRVDVAAGDLVERGQTLVVMEAMKMVHAVAAGSSGTVARVLVEPGQQVGMRALLVEITAQEG